MIIVTASRSLQAFPYRPMLSEALRSLFAPMRTSIHTVLYVNTYY